jgi:hypothetical protein
VPILRASVPLWAGMKIIASNTVFTYKDNPVKAWKQFHYDIPIALRTGNWVKKEKTGSLHWKSRLPGTSPSLGKNRRAGRKIMGSWYWRNGSDPICHWQHWLEPGWCWRLTWLLPRG